MYPPPAYGAAYGQPPPDPRSSPYGHPPADPYAAHHMSPGAPPPAHPDPYGQAPPPAGHDPYASHYDAYYRQQAGATPGYPPPAEAPPGYPPPSSSPPPGYPPPGYPPPDYNSYPPPGHAPPPADGSYPPPYGAPPPPGYGAPPPGYPPGYGAPPPGYPPPFGFPPPGYGPPPPGYGPPPPGYPGRGPSPGRDRRGINDRKKSNDGKGDGKGNNKKDKNQKKNDLVPEMKKLQSWLQVHSKWIAVWVEGIDPPRRMASTPNVTTLLLAKLTMSKSGVPETAFIYASSRTGLKKKDREKDCAAEILRCIDQLPLQDLSAWYQLPPPGNEKGDIVPDDLERLTKAVRSRYSKATVEVPEPMSFVLVESLASGPHQKAHGADADLSLLERYDPGFAELLREARRVSGLVRKQWYHAILWVKPEPGKDNQRPFPLGIGFATDRNLARARAVYSAETRLPILTDAMFEKTVREKQVPKKPLDGADVAP